MESIISMRQHATVHFPYRLRMNLENLFNHQQLSDGMNAILNDNDQLIFKELQVPLQNVLETVAKQIVGPVFNRFPYNEMFLNE